MLNREYYINKMEPYFEHWKIKCLTGIRGVGKTTILNQIIKKLQNEKKADNLHILYLNFEYIEFDYLKDAKILKKYILKKILDKKQYYIFLDEIQHVKNFGPILKSFIMNNPNISIFVACSNSNFVPGEIAVELSQKFIDFQITTLTYSEICTLLNFDMKNKNVLFNYLKFGGFPGRFRFNKSNDVKDYLYSLMDSIYLKDIVMRLGLSEINDLNCVLKYIVKNIGKDFSIFQLKDELILNENISEGNFYTYMDALSRSLIIEGTNIYNVRTNEVLLGISRYYINDLGLAFIHGFDLKNNVDGALKNLVYLELKRKGYDLYVGKNGESKIDLVAIYEEKIMYIQIVHLFEDGNSINTEIEKFKDFKALGKKYILSLDTANYTRNGVIHRNIIDFLNDKDIEISGIRFYQ